MENYKNLKFPEKWSGRHAGSTFTKEFSLDLRGTRDMRGSPRRSAARLKKTGKLQNNIENRLITVDNIEKKYIIIFFFIFILNVSLVWLFPYLPTQDGPCHLYNLTILKDLLNEGKIWGKFYWYNFRLTPNLGFTIFSYPLLNYFSPLVVEKIFLTSFFLLMVLSVLFFFKTFETPIFPNSFFVFPVLFNFNVFMGFYSYIISVPIFLLFLSLIFKFTKRSKIIFFLLFNFFAIIIFFIHLISCCFLLISTFVFKYAYRDKNNDSIVKCAADYIVISFPILILIFFYLSSGSSEFENVTYLFNYKRYIGLYRDLFTFSTAVFFPWHILPAVFLGTSVVIGIYANLKNIFFLNNRISLLKKVNIYLIVSFLIIYILAPFRFGEGSFFNQRFPWVIFLLSLPFLNFPDRKLFNIPAIWFARLSILLSFLFFFSNFYIFYQTNSILKNYLSGLKINFPESSVILPYKRLRPENSSVDFLLHASSYYGFLGKHIVLSNYQAESNLFQIEFHPKIIELPSQDKINYYPNEIDWSKYPKIDFLLCWNLSLKDVEILNPFYKKFYEKNEFSIWRRYKTN